MDVYIFNADIECESCGSDRARECQQRGVADDGDSGTYPQGPYANGGGEADAPQHCGSCREFLDNPLTPDGSTYVKARWREFVEEGRGAIDVLATWRDAYICEWAEFSETTEQEIEEDRHTDLAVRRFADLSMAAPE